MHRGKAGDGLRQLRSLLRGVFNFRFWFDKTLVVGLVLLLGPVIMEQDICAQEQKQVPVLWRQYIPGSSTTREVFVARSPQFILYRDGQVVYRGDSPETPYIHVSLSPMELAALLQSLETSFRLSAVTPNRLEREEPYIKSVQKRLRGNTSSVVVWVGMYTGPRLFRYTQELLEARSGNTELGPAWDSLYRCSQYLATFDHPRAQPLVPDRIEIAVQPLPSTLSAAASSAVPWPLPDIPLHEVQGTQRRGYRTLNDDAARRAYAFLADHSVITDGGETYQVWARPLLLAE